MKKVISIFLIVAIFCSCLATMSVPTSAENIKRYTVLVLDNSGSHTFRYSNEKPVYKSDTALPYVKRAVISFLRKMKNDKVKDMVAVVTFNSNVSVVSNFTDDYDKLETKINNLSKVNSNVNISLGLKKAKELLNDGKSSYKNVVLFSVGHTNTGDYLEEGCFDKSVVGHSWQNTRTKVKLYKYANYAYSIAQKIKEQCIAIYSIGLFQTMDNMPSQGKEAVELFKLTALNMASSPDKFFLVDNPDDIALSFAKIAENIDDFSISAIKTYGTEENFSNKTIFFKEEAKGSYKSALVTFKKEWFQSNESYNHGLAQFCAQYAMFGYSPDHSTKKKENTYIKTCLENGGFTVLDSNMNAARDEVNYFLAAKTIHLGGKRKQLLFVGTIGSNKEQWYSNFDPEGRGRKNGKGREIGKHCGFEDAKEFMVNKINGILFNGSYGFSKDNTILLFAGHSRGAATANLLAASAVNENAAWANAGSVFAYTFATPNNTLAKDYKSSKYSFIHNIVNPEDMVTHVMMKDTWKYHKYGKIYVLPSKTNTSSAKYKSYLTRMNHFYKNYKNDEYEPYTRGEAATHSIIQEFNKNMKSVDDFYSKKYYYKGTTWLEPYVFFKKTLLPYVAKVSKESKDEGYDNMIDVLLWNPLGFYFDIVAYFADPDIDFSTQHGYDLGMGGNFEQAHAMHTYCSYVEALNSGEITADRNSKYGSWNCPVDIEIYDNTTNELVGRIQNNTVDKEIEAKENSVVMTVDGDTKSYYLPADGDYTVKVIGNDNGTADYTLTTLGEDNNELERVNYYDIPVAKSQEMSATVQPEATAASVTLHNDNQQVIASDEVFENAQEAVCNVSVNVTGSGFVSGDGEAKIGDYAELTATAQCSTFLGWYSGGNCVSTDLVYKFRVTGDTSLSAKFSEGSHNYKEVVTEATCADKGTTEKVCENCGVSTIISETPALGHDYIAYEAQEPTCEESGWEAYQSCSRCEYSTYCELPAYGHVYNTVVTEPTCSNAGYTMHTCYLCGDSYTDNNVLALGHTYKTSVTAPTCTQDGYTKYDCVRCDDSYIGDKKQALGHTYKTSVTATCTESGYAKYYCVRCNDSYTGDEIQALGHSFGAWQQTKAPTCKVKGEETRVCARDASHKETREVAALGHSYKTTVKNPTAGSLGYTLHACSRCQNNYKDKWVAPTGKVSGLKCKTRKATEQTLTWKAVKGACSYVVKISDKTGKKWEREMVVTTNSCTVKKLKAGCNYKFKVKFSLKAGDGKKYHSNWSATMASPSLPTGTTLTKLTGGKKCFTAQWKKAPYTGYQIQYSTNAKFTGAKKATAKEAKKLKATIVKLSSKKVYYVRIRTYKTISKVHYFSNWSKVYKVKTK